MSSRINRNRVRGRHTRHRSANRRVVRTHPTIWRAPKHLQQQQSGQGSSQGQLLLTLLWQGEHPRSSARCLRCHCSQASRVRDKQHQGRVSWRRVGGVHRSRRTPIAPKPLRFKGSAVRTPVRRPVYARATSAADWVPAPRRIRSTDEIRLTNQQLLIQVRERCGLSGGCQY